MTEQEKLDAFVRLAAKTGRIVMSPDVWGKLMAKLSSLPADLRSKAFSIKLDVDPHLPAGTMLAHEAVELDLPPVPAQYRYGAAGAAQETEERG